MRSGDVEEIACEELGGRKRHAVPCRSVGCTVGEGNRFFGRRRDPAVRHGPSPDVAGQIDEHAFSVIVAGLHVDIPLLPAQFVLQVLPLWESHGRRKGEYAVSDGVVHRGKELSPEYGHDCSDGEEVAVMGCLFPCPLSKTSFGDEAMEVGMEDHGLAPCVEGGDDAGLCAEVLRV